MLNEFNESRMVANALGVDTPRRCLFIVLRVELAQRLTLISTKLIGSPVLNILTLSMRILDRWKHELILRWLSHIASEWLKIATPTTTIFLDHVAYFSCASGYFEPLQIYDTNFFPHCPTQGPKASRNKFLFRDVNATKLTTPDLTNLRIVFYRSWLHGAFLKSKAWLAGYRKSPRTPLIKYRFCFDSVYTYTHRRLVMGISLTSPSTVTCALIPPF
jgi:hypothetical protein